MNGGRIRGVSAQSSVQINNYFIKSFIILFKYVIFILFIFFKVCCSHIVILKGEGSWEV